MVPKLGIFKYTLRGKILPDSFMPFVNTQITYKKSIIQNVGDGKSPGLRSVRMWLLLPTSLLFTGQPGAAC